MRSSDLRYGFLPTYTSGLCSSTGSSRTASEYQRPSATISWSQQSGNALLLWLCLRLRIGHLLSPQTSALSNLVSHQTRSLMHQPAQPPVETKISAKKKGTLDESIGSQSIIYGGDINIATSFVNCKRLILGSNHKVYEVIWESQPAIDKCRSHVPNYAHEARAYEDIHTKGPQGYSLFSMMLHS